MQSEHSPFLNSSIHGVETLLSGLDNLMDIKVFVILNLNNFKL